MADRVFPSGVAEADPAITAGAIRYGGGDWIVPAQTNDYYTDEAGINSDLDAFWVGSGEFSATSHTVTVSTGEAFVGGAWLGRDTRTDVEIDGQVTNQTIYLGWRPRATHKIIIGRDDAAVSDFQPSDPRIPLWDVDTDGSGVTAVHDRRPMDEQINVRNEGSAAEADTLAGRTPNDFFELHENNQRFDVTDSGERAGVEFQNSKGRFLMAPITPAGDPNWNREITHNNGEWDIEGVPQAGGSNILTRSDEAELDVYRSEYAGDLGTTGRKLASLYSPTTTSPLYLLEPGDYAALGPYYRDSTYPNDFKLWACGSVTPGGTSKDLETYLQVVSPNGSVQHEERSRNVYGDPLTTIQNFNKVEFRIKNKSDVALNVSAWVSWTWE